MIYNVYVGNFKEIQDCYETQKKLNENYYSAKIVNLGIYFSLKVYMTQTYDEAYRVWKKLTDEGFQAQILNV